MNRTLPSLIACVFAGFLTVMSAHAQDEPFQGKIGKTLKDSEEY